MHVNALLRQTPDGSSCSFSLPACRFLISNKEVRKIRYDRQRGMYVPDSVRPQNKGYGEAGASWQRKAVKAFNAPSGSAHEDIDFNNFTLRQRARMLYMSSPIATSAIKTNRTNVVGVGLKLKSRIDREVLGLTPEQADAWQKATEREWTLWAEDKRSCDATGMNNFYGLEQLALVSWLLSGDCVGVLKQYETDRLRPYALRVHLIESDRIATPGKYGQAGATLHYTTGRNPTTGNAIYDGVEIDGNGAAVAYHIRSNHPFEVGAPTTTWTRIPAYQEHTGLPNIVHVMNCERPDQYRGVSILAPVIEAILQIRRYTESELMAAVIESFFTAFVKTEAPTDDMPFNQVEPDEPTERKGPNEYSMGPGQINIMEPGEDIVFGDPKRPAGGFDGFITAISTQIGAAIEIPADLLLKRFNASYSASRAALLEAWKSFKMLREWLADDFCRPIYSVWMSEAVARGRIYAPGFFDNPAIRAAYLGSEWLGPSQGQLDPVKEITAEILAVSEGFSTRQQSTVKLNGGQWDANAEQIQRETEKLNTQTGSSTGEDDDPGNNPHSPENAGSMSVKALRSLVLAEQIKQAIKGGQDDGEV